MDQLTLVLAILAAIGVSAVLYLWLSERAKKPK